MARERKTYNPLRRFATVLALTLASTTVLAQTSSQPTPDETPPEARRQAVPTDDVAVYATLDGRRFVLDRTGKDPKVQFEGSDEVIVLREEPASLGERLLKLSTGEVLLKITNWGGLTLYTPENQQGEPVDRQGEAQPISLGARPLEDLQREAQSLEASLSAALGVSVPVIVDWGTVPNDDNARATLFEAILHARSALGDFAADDYGRAALSTNLRAVQFMFSSVPGTEYSGGTWIIRVSPDQGLAGRLSAQDLRTALNATF
jgi:hypothetical protein